MNITAISDTHTLHKQVTHDLIGGDVLIHCGDFMSSGYSKHEIMFFLEWFNEQDYKHKIFIAGNHDRLFESSPGLCNEILEDYPDITYLQDSEVIIDGVKFYGTPWTPEFMGWAFSYPVVPKKHTAFNHKREEVTGEQHFSKIPEDTDVLITHGPAHMIRDYIQGQSVGCKHLAKRIKQVVPQYHVFGHIHEGYGGMVAKNDKTVHLNVSALNGQYNYTNKPIDFEVDNDT